MLSSPLVYVAWLLSPTVLSICLTIFDRIIPEVQPYLVLATLAGAGVLTVLFVTLPYFVLMEYSPLRGTLGKVLFGIAVATPSGEAISLKRSFGRYFAKYLSTAPVWIGFLVAAFNRRKRSFHDIVAGTVTITSGSGFVTPMTARVVALPIAFASLFAVGTVPDGMEERYAEVLLKEFSLSTDPPHDGSASQQRAQGVSVVPNSLRQVLGGSKGAIPANDAEVMKWIERIKQVPVPDSASLALKAMIDRPKDGEDIESINNVYVLDYVKPTYVDTLQGMGYDFDATMYKAINTLIAMDSDTPATSNENYMAAFVTNHEAAAGLVQIATQLYPMRSALFETGLISEATHEAFQAAGRQSEMLRWMGGDPATAGARTQSIRDSIRRDMDASRNRAGSARPGYQGSYGYNQQ